MSCWALVTAKHWLSLEFLLPDRQHKLDVVVINEGHESIIFSNCEHGLTDKIDESSLVSNVVHRGIDGNDDFAQLLACIIKSTLDLDITNAALLGVWAEDVIVLVDEAIELVLEVLDAGAAISDLELEVGREHWDDFVTFWCFASGCPDTALVAGVLRGRLIEEPEAVLAHSVAHGSLAPGDFVVTGSIMDDLRHTSAGGDGVDGGLEVRASLHIVIIPLSLGSAAAPPRARHGLCLYDEGTGVVNQGIKVHILGRGPGHTST